MKYAVLILCVLCLLSCGCRRLRRPHLEAPGVPVVMEAK